MTAVELLGVSLEETHVENIHTCPTGVDIPVAIESKTCRLFNITISLLPDCCPDTTYPWRDEVYSIEETEKSMNKEEYIEREIELLMIMPDRAPPSHIFHKEPHEFTEEDNYHFKDFSHSLDFYHRENEVCYKTWLYYVIQVFQYELLGKPLGKHFKELIHKLHHYNTAFYELANSTSTHSYELYISKEIELAKHPITHKDKCINRLNDLIKGLLPECSRHLYSGRYYANELFYMPEDYAPSFYIFSKEPEELTEIETEKSRFFNFTLTVLEDREDMCDKEGILYLVRIFQYELLGYPLSTHFKKLFKKQHEKNSKLFKLANNIAKESYRLYLLGANVDDIDTKLLPICPLDPESPNESTNTDKLTNIAKSLLPTNCPYVLSKARPIHFSESLILHERLGIRIGTDKEPPLQLFSKELTEELTKDEEIELMILEGILDMTHDTSDYCDKGVILYLVKIFHYKLLGNSLGTPFRELIEKLYDNDRVEILKLSASIAQRSYEMFKSQESA